jgi:hypothetical protein
MGEERRRDGAGSRGGRGMVLIITMLVVLGLSLLGSIIIDATRMDTTTSGHLREARQTAYIAEVGSMVAMRTFALNYSIYRTYMRRAAKLSYGFDRASFDAGAVGAPRTLQDGTIAAAGSIGYSDLVPDYATVIDRPYEFGDAKGYSVSGTLGTSFCFRRYTFTTAGDLGTTVGGTRRADAQASLRATNVIGPTDCTM